MLELMGSDFLIEHVLAEYVTRGKEMAYRSYTSDVLKAIAEFLGIEVSSRYVDLVQEPSTVEPVSADEIALMVISRAGLKVKDNECA